MIHGGLTIKQEADLFGRQAEGRKAPNEREQFGAALEAEIGEDIRARDLVADVGYTIADGEPRPRSARLLQCPKAIKKSIATYNAETVAEALQRARPQWDAHGVPPSGPTIRGLAAFVSKAMQQGVYDGERFAEALAELDPATITLPSHEPTADRRTAYRRVFERVRSVYNKGLRTRRVEEDDK